MSSFKMYEDISDKPGVVNLRARSKPITLRTHSLLFSSARTEPNDPGVTVVGMKEAVELARATFVKRLSHRVGKTLPLTICNRENGELLFVHRNTTRTCLQQFDSSVGKEI